MTKCLTFLVLFFLTTIVCAGNTGHWGGGYVNAHPDAYRQHQDFFMRDNYAGSWLAQPYSAAGMHRANRPQKCEYVKHPNCPYCPKVRRCYIPN